MGTANTGNRTQGSLLPSFSSFEESSEERPVLKKEPGICKECGESLLTVHAKYCSNCGVAVDDDSSESESSNNDDYDHEQKLPLHRTFGPFRPSIQTRTFIAG